VFSEPVISWLAQLEELCGFYTVSMDGSAMEMDTPLGSEIEFPKNALDNTAAQPPVNEKNNLLAQVSVTLSIEIGRLKMTLAEIASLENGRVVQLSSGPLDPVFLVVGQKRIGTGEVVDIDGKIGVRVLTMVDG
jgi:type III secretion system YscQ/HrcQ family protein